MASPLEGSLAAQIYKGLKSLFLNATLYRDELSTNSPDVDSFDPPTPTTTSYTCKAIVETYSDAYRLQDATISAKDRKVIILANSISVAPRNGDRFVIQGVTFTVMDVQRDPASATYTAQGRM